MAHNESHSVERIAWLRAAVLGANDGIVSVAALLMGVMAAGATRSDTLVAGLAGLTAGAMSMAAGEFVSVSSQADAEEAHLAQEREELETDPEHEHKELAEIYQERGVSEKIASQVATELMDHDALAAHARDELGITEQAKAKPLLAALASAAAFVAGALAPLLVTIVMPNSIRIPTLAVATIAALALLGYASAYLTNSTRWRAMGRITLWGSGALLLTFLIGELFGTRI